MERMSKDDQIAKARLEKKVKGASEAVIVAERMQQVIAELQVCEVWASLFFARVILEYVLCEYSRLEYILVMVCEVWASLSWNI